MTDSSRLVPCGDRSLLVYLGDAIDQATNERVHALSHALRQMRHPAVVEVTPSYHCLMVEYDPVRIRLDQLTELLDSAIHQLSTDPPVTRTVQIPVQYGGEMGPDLGAVAAHTGLTAEEVVHRHAEGLYRVFCLGFSPGFCYLGGLDPAMHTPRLAEPRVKVPAGSVGIGGGQTGIYPNTAPGGWQLIGRTPARLFDPDRDQPALLEPGDMLRFVPISGDQFAAMAEPAAAHATEPLTSQEGRTGLRLIHSGMATTIQDLGRRGFQRLGVPVAGAADFVSLMIGNWLLGNRARTSGLEITLMGPTVEFTGPSAFCLTGAPIAAELIPAHGGAPRPIAGWTTVVAGPGDRLRIGTAAAGCRSYLCIAGGFDLPLVLGSLSEDLFARIGPMGRTLREGDWLPIGLPLHPPADLGGRYLPADMVPVMSTEATIRVTRGPQAYAFAPEAFDHFFSSVYTISPDSDRQGMRLTGPRLAHRTSADILSEPIAPGSIQVPANGHPILLMGNRQTIGGYAKIAVAVYSDLAIAAQLRPGERLRFQEVDQAEAHAIAWAERRKLAQIRRMLERQLHDAPEATDPLPLPPVPTRGEREVVQVAAPMAPDVPGPARSFRITISGIEFEASVEEVE